MKKARLSVRTFTIAALLPLVPLVSCQEAPTPPLAAPGTGAETLTSTAATSITRQQARDNSAAGQPQISVLLGQPAAEGNLIVVALDYRGAELASIADSQGNTFTLAGSEVTSPNGARTRMYFANNIKGGTDQVTVALDGNADILEINVAEYSGADPVSPLDASAQISGTQAAVNVPIVTTADSDVLVAYCKGDRRCTEGSGEDFVGFLHLNSQNVLEDKTAGAAGTYAVTAANNKPQESDGFALVAAAFKPRSAVASVVVTPDAATIAFAATTPLTATLTDSRGNVLTGRTVTWSSSNANVASVDATGIVTGITAGTATITATAEGQSGIAAVTVLPPPPVTFVQAKALGQPAQVLSVPLKAATAAGNLVVVAFDYTGTTFTSISDSQGNVFTQVGSEVVSPGGAATRMYYAKNIKGGAETVTVTLGDSTSSLEIYVAEYRGADPISPLDGSAQNVGPTDSPVTSGTFVTTSASDRIVAYCVGDTYCHSGKGFAARSTLHDNLLEDRQVGAAGSYAATAFAGSSWGIVAGAFRQRVSGAPLPPPTAATMKSRGAGQ
jgi:hypothetical protein